MGAGEAVARDGGGLGPVIIDAAEHDAPGSGVKRRDQVEQRRFAGRRSGPIRPRILASRTSEAQFAPACRAPKRLLTFLSSQQAPSFEHLLRARKAA